MAKDAVEAPALDANRSRQQDKGQLRFLTCGGVGDGKSTLIGRLIYEANLLPDQRISLVRNSSRHGTVGTDIDFAVLVDGLMAEREPGITIDVAYRFFATERRKFIAADTPGHEQYTRNMATGASTSDLAVILVDASKRIFSQTTRHSYIASLMGVRHAILAVNKMDLVGYSQDVFDELVKEYLGISASLNFDSVTAIPMSAKLGDNITERGDHLHWYRGPTLLQHLETVDPGAETRTRPFRMPVQWVNRPDSDFCGYSGTVASGEIHVGDAVAVATTGVTSTIRSIVSCQGLSDSISEGETPTLVLSDDIDISRGDMLCSPAARPEIADQFAARLIWMSEEPLVPGRVYLFKIATKTVIGSVTEIKHTVDVTSLQHLAAKSLSLNDVALVNLSFHESIAFDPYAENRTTGGFIVIDRLTNQTVGAGTIEFALRRASNIHWQATEISKHVRSGALGQHPAVIWFTGLSGSGKSTLANLLERRLFALRCHTYLIDGDNVRHGLNRDLGFTEADRVENIRRVAEVAHLFVDSGLIVLVSLISPFRSERRMAREMFEPGEFIEVFVDVPLRVAEKRDPKGLYKQARAGLIKNFTGVDSPYEPPETPELFLDANLKTPEALVDEIISHLQNKGVLKL